MKRAWNLPRRYAMPVVIVFFSLAALGIGLLLLLTNARQTERAVGSELKAIATHAASHIDPAAYYRLFFAGDRLQGDFKGIQQSADFSTIRRTLLETAGLYGELNLGENNIYTFVRDLKTEELRWGVMLHPTPFSGESYLPPAVVDLIVANGKPGFSGVYLSRASNREWISGYAPVLWRGQVIGLVEVAREITEVTRTERMRLIPMIAAGAAVILLAMIAIALLLNSSRRLSRSHAELERTFAELEKSTSTYRTLTESSTDIIFSLNAEFSVISINGAARRQLGINPVDAQGKLITDVLFKRRAQDTADDLFDPALLRNALKNLKGSEDKLDLIAALQSGITGEPKEYRIRIERISSAGGVGYIGRAVGQGEMAIAGLIDRARFRFSLKNSLLLTEELAAFLAGLCRRYTDEGRAKTVRIMLREMLLNAIEHGNLGIDFKSKSDALEAGNYFELIDERRRMMPYRDRIVSVDVLIANDKMAFRITDEGEGFDHKKMIQRLSDGKNEGAHGRGIVMTMQEFDVVRYNDKGNTVTLIKKIL